MYASREGFLVPTVIKALIVSLCNAAVVQVQVAVLTPTHITQLKVNLSRNTGRWWSVDCVVLFR